MPAWEQSKSYYPPQTRKTKEPKPTLSNILLMLIILQIRRIIRAKEKNEREKTKINKNTTPSRRKRLNFVTNWQESQKPSPKKFSELNLKKIPW
ncbi:MAG: hypothetical protein LBB91_11775 [Clostridiales bacterium]|jgi:hypothetical protein|nr:hypothetical protein [Clostridiales bacterium]